MTRLVVLAALLGGCTFGFGSPYVGQWKAREEVEFEVCVENDAGECQTKKTVTRHERDRKFWGFKMSYPMMGISFPKIGDDQQTLFRMDLNAEFLWGKGNYALGVRQSVVFDAGDDFFITTPLMLMSHVGLNDRLAAYAGAGFSYVNRRQQYENDMVVADQTGHVGGRILGGLNIVGSTSQRHSRILYTIEGDTSLSSIGGQTLRSFGVTLSIGLFL